MSFSSEADTTSIPVDSASQTQVYSKPLHKRIRPYSLPALLMGYGFMSLDNKAVQNTDKGIKHEIAEHFSKFSTKIDDKLQYAPALGVYALNIFGVKGKNKLVDRSLMYFVSMTIMDHAVD